MGLVPELLSDYRNAFAGFAQKVRPARALMAASNPDWQAIDAALLAQQLNSSPFPEAISETNRVSEIAELRWELAGQPEGRDDENWYRAEDIVRRATAA